MSYLVLARKLRPQRFDEIVGQQALVRTLSNALSSGRIHHAFLFCGPRGTGKTTTARILAKALNCEQGPTPTPCNQCRSCEEITGGTAVDVLEIDGASNTGVDDVRQLRENARYLPVNGRRKIYVIDEVHMLSVSAFNALLKTLEEPPEHVTFVFATTEPHKIPVTILSRCQRYDLGRVATEPLIAMLSTRLPEEGIHIDDEGLDLIAQASEGSVRDALSLVDQVLSYTGEQDISGDLVREALGLSDRETLLRLSEAVLERDGARALAVLDDVYQGGRDLLHFASSFLGHLRDLAVAALVREPGPLIRASAADLQALSTQAEGVDPLWLQQLFDRFAVAVDRVARADSPRLVLEMALVGLVQAEPLEPLGELLGRLEALESGVPPPPRPRAAAPAGKALPRGKRASPLGGAGRAPARPRERSGRAAGRGTDPTAEPSDPAPGGAASRIAGGGVPVAGAYHAEASEEPTGTGTSATGTNTTGADFSEAEPARASPSGADLSGADLSGVDLSGAEPNGANPDGADPAGIDPAGIDPAGAEPAGADPAGARHAGAEPSGATPAGARHAGAEPAGTDPALAPPLSRRSVLPAEPMAAWEELVRLAERHSRRLAANLYRASLLSLSDELDRLVVEIGVTNDSFEHWQLAAEGAREELARYLSRRLAKPVTVRIQGLDTALQAAPTLSPAPTAGRGEVDTPAHPPAPPAGPEATGGTAGEAAADPPATPQSLRARDEQWRREERERKRKEACDHAAVKDSLEVLEGQITDIHVEVD